MTVLDASFVRRHAVTLDGGSGDYDGLLRAVGDRHVVLLGEASHGSHEFYRERARITQRLIEELGFTAVAVEADWPDAYRVNRYVQGRSDDPDATAALSDFRRFPAWMWRNDDVVDFVEWLRGRNDLHPPERRAGFYGLDLYSLATSMNAVVRYLDGVDPSAAAAARERYSCFDHVHGEGAEYGHAVTRDLMVPCEDEVVAQLVDLRRLASSLLAFDGWTAADEYFFAEQNAQLVLDAERYYRAMYQGRALSWNLRDEHMTSTLGALAQHLGARRADPKIVVWEHNSHIGDARATEMGVRGELNVGQLVRTAWRDDCLLVGFTTYDGTVTAATDWGGPAERKGVNPAMEGSFESLFHESGGERFLLRCDPDAVDPEGSVLLERAIGVIYRPLTERTSHWFHARLPAQFDVVVHIDRTTAVRPLERTGLWEQGSRVEPPETYPTGL